MTEVRLDIDGGVALITLAAPERRNALTPTMVSEFIAACDEIDANAAIGAVVLRAEGNSFCAGAHLAQLKMIAADPAKEENLKELTVAYGAFERFGRLLPPTIAAVRGAAVGAGMNLVMAADLRVLAEDARLIAGFMKIGIHPGGGHFALVARTAGREPTVANAVFSEEISGTRAVALGIAWDAVPADQVEVRAIELARRPAADPTLARRVIKSMRLALGPPSVSWPIALEAETMSQMWSLRRRFAPESQSPP